MSSNKDGPLISSSLRSFLQSLAARTSAPGGGSASVVSAAMVIDALQDTTQSILSCYVLKSHTRTHARTHTRTHAHMHTRTHTHTHAHTHTHTHTQGVALSTMVGLLTYGKRKYEDLDDVMRKTIGPLHDNLEKMMPLVDKDSEAFTDYMVLCVCACVCDNLFRTQVAMKLPQKTDEEKKMCVCECACVWV